MTRTQMLHLFDYLLPRYATHEQLALYFIATEAYSNAATEEYRWVAISAIARIATEIVK